MSGGSILIVSEHTRRGYSGGRYHSWMMAEAIAAGGRDVTVWTNVQPFLTRDFLDFPAHDRVNLFIDPAFTGRPEGEFDAVVVVPSLSLDWSATSAALTYAQRSRLPLVFLDFEAPTWYNSENSRKRSWLRVLSWKIAARYSDLILSTTVLGSLKASDCYKPLAGKRAFRSCYCAINSLAADKARTEKRDQIICITRLDRATPHKGASDLLPLMCEELRGYRVVVIGSLPGAVKAQFQTTAAAHGMTVAIRTGLTDLEKFEEIKASRLMVFLSHFEGFGLPPLEALYCGTPCLVRPLPVLRETGGEYFLYIEPGEQLSKAVVEALNKGQDEELARSKAAEIADFSGYVDRLKSLIDELLLECRPSRPRTAIDIAAFSLAARVCHIAIRLVRRTKAVAWFG